MKFTQNSLFTLNQRKFLPHKNIPHKLDKNLTYGIHVTYHDMSLIKFK